MQFIIEPGTKNHEAWLYQPSNAGNAIIAVYLSPDRAKKLAKYLKAKGYDGDHDELLRVIRDFKKGKKKLLGCVM